MSDPPIDAADIVARAVLDRLGAALRRPLIVGICGAQGSGKTTLCAALEGRLKAAGLRAAVLSLDDLYLPRSERERLAETIHPLLRTRGVPGTHDVGFGIEVLERLARGDAAKLPRFDKATEMRLSMADWPVIEGKLDVLLFEGWCVGARPQHEEALSQPLNVLECRDDSDGRWRRGVNEALAGDYQRLFGFIDMLVLLAAPGFDVVSIWRAEQERTLRHRLAAEGRPQTLTMSDAEISHFIQFYERLTRHILAEMPVRADLVIRLDAWRRVIDGPTAHRR